VLANSQRAIDPDVPSPGQFDHLISVMPTGTDRASWIWTDTTMPVAPFRHLMPNLRGKSFLLAAKSTAPSALIETPKLPATPMVDKITVTGTLSDLGTLDLHVSSALRSDGEVVLRNVLSALPRARWNDLGEALAKRSWIGGTVSELTASDPIATREPLHLEFRQVRENFVAFDANGHYRMPMPVNRTSLSDTTEDDWKGSEPVELGLSELTTHVQLAMPDTVTMQAPVDVTVSRDYADYTTTYRVAGHALTMDRTIRFKMASLPTSRGADYLAFVRAIRADEEQRVELERKGSAPAGPSPTANASADDLHRAARAAHTAGRYAEAIDLYKRAIAIEPQHKYAWNNLGLSQLALDRLDDAVVSFRKQIEINPFDQWSYNNLGQALRRQHKYDEAATAFNKQIEINPLDQFAWKNLGSMANARGQYAEARAALEKAVAVTPADAPLRVNLGEVYLRLKLDAEAMSAFEKAVQIAPVPPIWNDIAYALAQNEVHLDRAQQYAESAVNSHETVLRQVTLDTLTIAQMRIVNSLAAAWDTLGWVAFKRGDLVIAERYLRASWLLSQEDEVGDHLAKLYEKQGKAPGTLMSRGAKELIAQRTVSVARPPWRDTCWC
jgi:tetratricopeptide (TPR) repeat protein